MRRHHMTRSRPGGQRQVAGTRGVCDGVSQHADSESKPPFSSGGRTAGKGHRALVCRVLGLREKGLHLAVEYRSSEPRATKILIESSRGSLISSKPSPWLGVHPTSINPGS